MSETSASSSRDGDDLYDLKTPIQITLQLHELIGLAVLYHRSPEDIDLLDEGYWWGESVDLAMLRIAEAISRTVGSKEGLLRAGALRAYFDQQGIGP